MKLDLQHKHILRLIRRDAKSDGWTIVSDKLYCMLSDNIPSDLAEFKWVSGGGGRARLTKEGEIFIKLVDKYL